MPRASKKKLHGKSMAEPSMTPVEEKPLQQIQSTPIEQPPTHLLLIGLLVLITTSFILGGRAFAGLAIIPKKSPATHEALMVEVQKLNQKIDGLTVKLGALDKQHADLAEECRGNSVVPEAEFTPEPTE